MFIGAPTGTGSPATGTGAATGGTGQVAPAAGNSTGCAGKGRRGPPNRGSGNSRRRRDAPSGK